MKQFIKKCLSSLGIYISKNQRYDALLERILSTHLSSDSNCVDVGSHKGEILDLFLKFAPDGKHIGFEPLPELAEALKKNYKNRAIIKEYGLSSESGTREFTHVKNAEAFSGFKERDYQNRDVHLDTIKVKTCTLDKIIQDEHITPIKLIKIDVEGAEMEVLEGGLNTISTHKPLVVFEHGKGAAEFYDTTPKQVYEFFIQRCQMNISTLTGFLNNNSSLSGREFSDLFESGKEYYFIAHS